MTEGEKPKKFWIGQLDSGDTEFIVSDEPIAEPINKTDGEGWNEIWPAVEACAYERVVAALKLCRAQAGIHEADDACRMIISTANKVLNGVGEQ